MTPIFIGRTVKSQDGSAFARLPLHGMYLQISRWRIVKELRISAPMDQTARSHGFAYTLAPIHIGLTRRDPLVMSITLAIPRPRVRQTAVFPSHTKQPNNQANQNQSINKSSQFHEPILLHLCCPGPQPAGEGSAAGLLLPVSGELLGVRSGMVGGKTTEESECGEERRPNGRGRGHLCLPTHPSDSYHTRNSFASPRRRDHFTNV